jgi:hypothetical protein
MCPTRTRRLLAAVPTVSIQSMENRVVRANDRKRMVRIVAGVEVAPPEAGHPDPVPYPERLVELIMQHA